MKQLKCEKCGKVQNYINRESVGVTKESVMNDVGWKTIKDKLYCAACKGSVSKKIIDENVSKVREEIKKEKIKEEVKEEVIKKIKKEAKEEEETKVKKGKKK